MNAYYVEDLFGMEGDEDLAAGIFRLDGEIIRVEPIGVGHIESMILTGADIAALVQLFTAWFENSELNIMSDAIAKSRQINGDDDDCPDEETSKPC